MIAILDKTCYTALKNHARTYSIFSALRQEKSPPCAMLFCSKALHLTRHAIFSFNVQFCPRLYLLSTLLFDIFNTTSRKIPPPLCNVVPLKSTTFNKTHAIFSFNVQFCPRLYLLSTLLFDIFNTTSRTPPPRRAMWFRSKALHLTRLVRFFRLMYSFVQRLYLLYMYLGLDVTCIFCNLSRQVKYRC